MAATDNSSTLLLSQDDWRRVQEHAQTLNILDPKVSLEYGLTLQKKIAALPNTLMNQLKNDLAPQANDLIPALLAEIDTFTPEDDVLKNPMKNRKAFKKLRAEYNKISQKIAELLAILQEQELVLMQNASTLKKLESNTTKLYRSLLMHVEAGKLCIIRIEKILEAAPAPSDAFGDEFATRETIKLSLRSFKERVSSLEITQHILNTMLLQIRTYKATNDVSLNKVKETYHKTIPAWRKKLTVALRMGDVVDVIYASKGGTEGVDVEAANKGLAESISDLKNSFVSNQTSKAALDEVYLLSKALEKELQKKDS